MYILAEPLSMLIRPIYQLVQNYGWTLVIVTVLINLLTIPLTIMSQKSMSKTQQLQPLLMELQKKYANDKEKYSAEMQKLYTKYGINPMAGCLPMVIRLFIILGFVGVVYNPLQYLLRMTPEQINAIKETLTAAGEKVVYQVQYCAHPETVKAIEALGKEPINFNFLGIDLTKMLSGNMGDITVWIIPAMAVLATIASSVISKKLMAAQSTPGQPNPGNSMLYIMPVMTAYFTYIMPIGMSLYWFTSTVVNLIQQIFTNLIIKKSKKELPLTPNDKKLLEGQKKSKGGSGGKNAKK